MMREMDEPDKFDSDFYYKDGDSVLLPQEWEGIDERCECQIEYHNEGEDEQNEGLCKATVLQPVKEAGS